MGMTLLRCKNIVKTFGEHDVLQGVNFEVAKHDKIGLVGFNGTGKSTLANIIAGRMQQDTGQIECLQANIRVGYLRQDATFELYENNERLDIEKENSYWEIASHLGVDDWQGERLQTLSGGEKTKLALALAWSVKLDLLILDEPTNHLDFQGVEWLVEELNASELTTIIISHDRYFLDQTTRLIAELESGKLSIYKGNYTAYRDEKKRRYESQLHQYEEQKKVEAHIEQEIARLKEWSAKAHRESGKKGEVKMGLKEYHRKKAKMMDRQVKSRIKRLEKMELEGVKKPTEERKVYFDWNQIKKRGSAVVLAEQIGKAFHRKTLFQASSFYIQRGEKVGIVGPNGCGKTTLLHIICGQLLPDNGHFWTSPTIKISRLEQGVKATEQSTTVNEWLSQITTTREQFANGLTMLINMGFPKTILRKSICSLSHGEQIRLRIAQLVMQQQDVLVLDEPTNHLDLIYREQLEQTLLQYEGTLVVVSHDRYFLETICDKLLVFENDKVVRKEYGFNEYMQRRGTSKKKSGSANKSAQQVEQLLIIENELSYVVGELAKYEPTSTEYVRLDAAFKELVRKKRALT